MRTSRRGIAGRRRRKEQPGSETENRGVGADGDGDRDRGRQDQQWLAPERSKRVAKILCEVADDIHATRIAALFFNGSHRTEIAQRGLSCLVAGHAAGDVLVDLFGEMDLKLVSHRRVDRCAAEERAHPQSNPDEPAVHITPPPRARSTEQLQTADPSFRVPSPAAFDLRPSTHRTSPRGRSRSARSVL